MYHSMMLKMHIAALILILHGAFMKATCNNNCVSKDPFIRIYSRVCCGYIATMFVLMLINEKCKLEGTQLRPTVKPSVNEKLQNHGCKVETATLCITAVL